MHILKTAGALLLCLGALPVVARSTTSPLASQPDTTTAAARPVRHQSIKLGLQSSNYGGQLPTLAYERALGRHLGLQASASYYGSTWRSSYSYVNDDNTVTDFATMQRDRRVTGQLQARYYFQRHTPALIGWYAGLGLSTAYTHSYATSALRPEGTTSQSLKVQPQLRLGRQWALGQRLLLDTFVGLDINQLQGRLPSGRHPWIATPAVGFQLGYRF